MAKGLRVRPQSASRTQSCRAKEVKGRCNPIHPKLLLLHPTGSNNKSYGSWQVMKGISISISKAIFFKLNPLLDR
ncbi:MAG TPA: hypothetical protein VKV30_03070, partial [Candidatus Angelobacter sp.]|nr:hypothetical protein [Candidatus Angelobacter sp.]